jgi:hypothetical protein
VDYAFEGLPASVPVGTSLGMTNAGADVHELALVRIADDVTASVEELMTMEGDVMEQGLVEPVGDVPLFAAPGAVAPGTILLEREGRYVAICFIPQGLTDISALQYLSPEADPSAVPADIQALLGGTPHALLGMVQEFTVTAAGSTPSAVSAAVPPPAPAS